MSKKSLIITGGSIDRPFAIKVWNAQEWDQVIGVDSALRFCVEEGLIPDVILGDFDSAHPEDVEHFREMFPERVETFPSEKDETDTELAVDCAIRAGADKITILGGTGTRVDHLLGNVQLLKRALDDKVSCVLVDPNNRIRMIRKKLTIKKKEQFGDYVSLLPFTTEVKGLTLTGFEYDVRDIVLSAGTTRGISNEIREEEAVISFREGLLLVIESRDM